MSKKYPVIKGLGFSIPINCWDNKHIESIVDTSDEWILSRTGIANRYIACEGETTASLGAAAALNALKDSGLSPSDIDIIILATMSPEMPFPATACFVQQAIGAHNAAAFRYFCCLFGIYIWFDNRIRLYFVRDGQQRSCCWC